MANPNKSGDGILVSEPQKIYPERVPTGPTEQIPDPKKELKVPAAKFYVAPGKAVVCRRGAIPQMLEVTEADFANGMSDVEHLIKIGVVVRGKQ